MSKCSHFWALHFSVIGRRWIYFLQNLYFKPQEQKIFPSSLPGSLAGLIIKLLYDRLIQDTHIYVCMCGIPTKIWDPKGNQGIKAGTIFWAKATAFCVQAGGRWLEGRRYLKISLPCYVNKFLSKKGISGNRSLPGTSQFLMWTQAAQREVKNFSLIYWVLIAIRSK